MKRRSYIKDADEWRRCSGAPEALANTVKIAERCQVEFEFGKYHLPEFDVPDGYTSLEYLQKLCDEGFARRYPNDDGTVHKRLQYEIDMIAKMALSITSSSCPTLSATRKVRAFRSDPDALGSRLDRVVLPRYHRP